MESTNPVNESNLGPVVSIVAWVTVAAVILSVSVKMALSFTAMQRYRADTVILIATVFSVGYTIALSIAVPNGIGRHENTYTSSQLDIFQKSIYASDLLLICTVATSQIAILSYLYPVTPVRLHKRALLATAAFILILWAAPNLLASAFQCSTPAAWRILGPHCFDQVPYWTAYAVINIIIELVLIGLPSYIIWTVKIAKGRKAVVIGGFAARSLVIGAFIAQLVELQPLSDKEDYTYKSWKYYLCTQVVQTFSVITVCIPYVRILLLEIESGMMQTGHIRLGGADNKIQGQRATAGPDGSIRVHPSSAAAHQGSRGEPYALSSQRKGSKGSFGNVLTASRNNSTISGP